MGNNYQKCYLDSEDTIDKWKCLSCNNYINKNTNEVKKTRRISIGRLTIISVPMLLCLILFISFIIFFIYESKLRYIYIEDTDSYEVRPGYFYNEPNVVIPYLHNNKRVTTLSENAFRKCDYLKAIDLTYINEISNKAINNCPNLSEVVLSDNLTYIGENNFHNCPLVKDVVLPDSKKTGYTFIGWEVNDDLVNNVTLNSIDKAYTAKFKVNTYNITYNTNGGYLPKGAIKEVTYDSIYTLPIPNRTGLVFFGWYYNNSLIDDKTWKISSDVILVARWFETYKEGEYTYIDFGTYPQTVVLDESITKELDKLYYTNEKGYYEYNGSEYTKVIANPWEDKYMFSDKETVIIKDTTYYFKVEPIKWRVLFENNEYFLLSEYLLDKHEFYNKTSNRIKRFMKVYPNNYEFSTIRSWLNNDFYNKAFLKKERDKVSTVLLDNGFDTLIKSKNRYVCHNTNDKVFLITKNDLSNSKYGFQLNSNDVKEQVRAKLTDYSLAIGCYVDNYIDDEPLGCWWLRSTSPDTIEYYYNYDYLEKRQILVDTIKHINMENVYIVNSNGRAFLGTINSNDRGVRPAIRVIK